MVLLSNASFPINDVPLEKVDDKITSGRKLCVIIGAGIAGLMAALVLAQEDMEVIVLERRNGDFTRFNMVNLKMECEEMLDELGLLDDFKKHVGTRLASHTYHSLEFGSYEQFNVSDMTDMALEDPLQLSFENLNDHFKHDGLYAVMIAEFQQFLAKHALNTGKVTIVTEVDVTLLGDEMKSVHAKQGDTERRIEQPDLIVLADGGGKNYLNNNWFDDAIECDHPCHDEKWLFASARYNGTKAHVNVIIDKQSSGTCGTPTTAATEKFTVMSNFIFNPRHKQVNIAVTVPNDDMCAEEIVEKITSIAEVAYQLNGIQEDVVLESMITHVVTISNRICHRFTHGRNLIIAGDRAGTSSPLAGLGASLSVIAYPVGIRTIARALHTNNAEEVSYALQGYDKLARAAVLKWFSKSKETRVNVRDNLHPKGK